jgi:hypothetical protein
MASVYVGGRDLPIGLEFIDQDSAEVADPVEDWCQRGEVATFKRLPTRVVINFGQTSALIISMERDPHWPEGSIVSCAARHWLGRIDVGGLHVHRHGCADRGRCVRCRFAADAYGAASRQLRMGVRRGEIPSQIELDALTADRVCVARSTFLFKTASMRACMIQTTGT